MDEEAEVDREPWGQVSLLCGGMTRHFTILPILYGFGLKLLGRSKLAMHYSASIKKIERAMISPQRLAVTN